MYTNIKQLFIVFSYVNMLTIVISVCRHSPKSESVQKHKNRFVKILFIFITYNVHMRVQTIYRCTNFESDCKWTKSVYRYC